MAKPVQMAFFPGVAVARIWHRKVDKRAVSMKSFAPFFDTWDDAHAHMLAEAQKRAKRAKAESASADRHLAKVLKLVKPVG